MPVKKILPVRKTLPVKKILLVGRSCRLRKSCRLENSCRLRFLPDKIFSLANRLRPSAWTTTASPAPTSGMRSCDLAAPSPQSCPERPRYLQPRRTSTLQRPPDLRRRVPENLDEMSRVAAVPDDAADDDDSPADNPRSGIFATMASNVGPYGEPGDDQRPDRDGRLLDDARFDDAACRTTTINETTMRTGNVKGLRTASTRDGLSFTARPHTSSPTTVTIDGGARSSNLLKRTNIRHRGPGWRPTGHSDRQPRTSIG